MEWLKSLVSHTTLVQWLILAALVSLGVVLRELTAAVKALIDLLDNRLRSVDRHYARIVAENREPNFRRHSALLSHEAVLAYYDNIRKSVRKPAREIRNHMNLLDLSIVLEQTS
jgi:hypothetical protein